MQMVTGSFYRHPQCMACSFQYKNRIERKYAKTLQQQQQNKKNHIKIKPF